MMKPFFQRPASMITIALYGLSALATVLTFATQDYDTAYALYKLSLYSGLAGAVALGIALAQGAADSVRQGNYMNNVTYIAVFLLIASIVAGIFTLIPGLILYVIATKRSDKPLKQIPKAGKYALVTAAFLGGGVGGLVVAIFLAFISGQRACELSSSKCY